MKVSCGEHYKIYEVQEQVIEDYAKRVRGREMIGYVIMLVNLLCYILGYISEIPMLCLCIVAVPFMFYGFRKNKDVKSYRGFCKFVNLQSDKVVTMKHLSNITRWSVKEMEDILKTLVSAEVLTLTIEEKHPEVKAKAEEQTEK